MNLVHDEMEIRTFFNRILPSEWKKTDGAFISLAARRKYVPEGLEINLGHRPEMLDRDVIRTRDIEEYIAKIRRYDCPFGYVDVNGHPIPQECMAVYVNIHLSDSIAAWRRTKEKIAEVDAEIAAHAFNGGWNLEHISRQVRNLSGIWLTQMQNSYSKKRWIDYDIDLIHHSYRKAVEDTVSAIFLTMKLPLPVMIATRGGIHVLLNTETALFSKDVNPETILVELRHQLDGKTTEVVRNENGMVPLPGTMQGGFPVHFVTTGERI